MEEVYDFFGSACVRLRASLSYSINSVYTHLHLRYI